MSLERRREPKRSKEKENLQDSSFRRLDFKPLEEVGKTEDKIEHPIEELTEIEKDVLDIAKDILKLKRYETDFEIESESQIQKYPIIEKLYAKCIAKLSYRKGYSKEEIFMAIRSLEEKNWIVTNERRTKLEILTNEKLVKILDFIKENPGIHARDEKIEIELKITRTPFLKHIMTLERFKLIRSKKIGKTLHFFLSDVPEDHDKYKIIFLNPLIPKILEQMFKNESVTISKMAEILDMYAGTMLYHIKKLKELNLVKSTKNQSGKKIHLVNIELLKIYNNFFDEPDFSLLLQGL
jgi:predicted transcriptional regulator